MLANLILSSKNLMDNPKDATNMKSTHFASNLEVFNYTDSKANNSDDEFLLTPNEKQKPTQNHLEVQIFQEKLPQEINTELNQYQAFENEIKKKREEFRRRMTCKGPAKLLTEVNSVPNTPSKAKDEGNRQEDNSMEVEVPPRQNSSISIKEQEILKSPSLKVQKIKEDQKSSVKKPPEPLSLENQSKIASLKKIREKGHPQIDNPLIRKQKQDRRRVTQDIKSLINMGIFSHKPEENQETKATQNEIDKGEEVIGTALVSNIEKQMNNRRRESLIDKALSRLSSGNVSRTKKTRVTLDTNEISNFLKENEDKPQSWISKMNSIKQEVEQSNKIAEQKDKYKEELRRQIEQTNFRVKNIHDKDNEIHEENIKIQNFLKQQEGFLNYLDQQINNRVKEHQTITDKKNKYKMRTDSAQKIKPIAMPLHFLQSNFNVKVVNYQFNKIGGEIMANYILDFIMAQNIYIRIKKLENHTPVIFIRSDTVSETIPPEWVIDIKLRIELLGKYFKLKLQTLENIEMLLEIAKYYEHLQLLQNDFRMIQKIYDIKDLTLCPSNEKLSFSLDIQDDKIILITVNLLEFREPSCYILESIHQNQKRRESQQRREMKNCNGSISLIQFIYQALEKMIL